MASQIASTVPCFVFSSLSCCSSSLTLFTLAGGADGNTMYGDMWSFDLVQLRWCVRGVLIRWMLCFSPPIRIIVLLCPRRSVHRIASSARSLAQLIHSVFIFPVREISRFVSRTSPVCLLHQTLVCVAPFHCCVRAAHPGTR